MQGIWGCMSETHTQNPFPACCSCLGFWGAGLFHSTGCVTFRGPHPTQPRGVQSRLGNAGKCHEQTKAAKKNLLTLQPAGVSARLDLCLFVPLCQKCRENHSKELVIRRTGSAPDRVTFVTKASAQAVLRVLVTAGAQLSAWAAAICIGSGRCPRLSGASSALSPAGPGGIGHALPLTLPEPCEICSSWLEGILCQDTRV